MRDEYSSTIINKERRRLFIYYYNVAEHSDIGL